MRGYAQFIEIGLPPEQVFAAFTSKAQLERWYAREARIDARRGGSLTVVLRDGRRRDATIDVYDPGRRLRLIYLADATLPPSDGAVVEDVLFDPKGAGTVVRVMGAGVPDDPAWDRQLLWARQAWRYWLNELKRVLEAPAGGAPA